MAKEKMYASVWRKTPIKVLPDGTLSFQCNSDLYGVTDAGGHVEHAIKHGFVPLGDGCDYVLQEGEAEDLKKMWAKVKRKNARKRKAK
jgi:hypothetical protein